MRSRRTHLRIVRTSRGTAHQSSLAWTIAWALLLSLLVAPAVAAASAATSDECLMCHRDPSLAKTAGRAGSLFVDGHALARSAHAGLACVDCHRDAKGAQHASHLAPVRCSGCHAAVRDSLAVSVHARAGDGSQNAGPETACKACHGTHDIAAAAQLGRSICANCHAGVVAEYTTSVHAVALAHGDPEASTCRDCHGATHGVRRHTDSGSSVSRERLAETCARCHADRELMTRRKITIPQAVQLFRNSVHGRSKDARAATCSDCHESHRLQRATQQSSSIYRTNIPATCGRCHAKETAAYRTGVHGTALARGVTASPVCTDCHGEHMIRGPNEAGSPVASAQVAETCARCHEATGIRETFGLPAGRLSTYRDSFHGLAARGGSPAVANCASCHGFHDILPSTDARSTVAPARLGETCGRCHPGAGSTFSIGAVHVPLDTPLQPASFWARRIYLLLILLTIGFMLLHNGLDFARKIATSLAEHAGRAAPHARKAGEWFERMTWLERVQHVLLAVSFFTLVYTGFALKFPEAWPFAWLARLEGGYSWRSVVHRVAAVAMVIVSLFHVGYLLTRRGRELVAALFPTLQDATEMLQNTLYLLGLRRDPPRFGRFGYIEKAEYWALIWGTVVMTVTGLLLWFENEAMRSWPKWTLDLATVIHYYEAWLAFLAIVVWHVYQNIVNPDVYPMNWTWLTGKIPGWQMQHEHAREYERLQGLEAPRAAAVAAAAAAAPETATQASPAGEEPPAR
jgi:cytochrome b subunit of formate dehydrogenase